jgi:hypothetical protein
MVHVSVERQDCRRIYELQQLFGRQAQYVGRSGHQCHAARYDLRRNRHAAFSESSRKHAANRGTKFGCIESRRLFHWSDVCKLSSGAAARAGSRRHSNGRILRETNCRNNRALGQSEISLRYPGFSWNAAATGTKSPTQRSNLRQSWLIDDS